MSRKTKSLRSRTVSSAWSGRDGGVVGAEVRYLEAEDGRFIDKDILQRELDSFRPDVVTAVHCETPSGLSQPDRGSQLL